MTYKVKIQPQGRMLEAEPGKNVLELLREQGIELDAPCGGNGKCGRCRVIINGTECCACGSGIEGDTVITVPEAGGARGFTPRTSNGVGDCIAVDIGTTTVVCSLIRDGRAVDRHSCLNPQRAYGADVVSRLRSFCPEQTRLIRDCVEDMILSMCEPSDIKGISVAANPAMQQIFLGMGVDNLVKLPYMPVLKRAEYIDAREILPRLETAEMLIIPQISAYVGADTLACVMATELYRAERPTLLVDIGTNAEIVLGRKDRLLCCAAAAGPALEGADISCGMRAEVGAVDRVSVKNGELFAHIIGDGEAKGICGSGIIDAVAALLDTGRLDGRGKIIPKGAKTVEICPGVRLTQEDIQHIRLAKAAICAGILTLCGEYGISPGEIEGVFIAGAFGSCIDVHSACRAGLLPPELERRAKAVGNSALSGAERLAGDRGLFQLSERVRNMLQSVELGSSDSFRRYFAENMYFTIFNPDEY